MTITFKDTQYEVSEEWSNKCFLDVAFESLSIPPGIVVFNSHFRLDGLVKPIIGVHFLKCSFLGELELNKSLGCVYEECRA